MTQEEYYKDALSTLKNGEKYLLDMIGEYPVGVRVICSFEEEVYQVAEWLCKRNPGYRKERLHCISEAEWLPQSASDREGKKRRIRRHDRRNTASDDCT